MVILSIYSIIFDQKQIISYRILIKIKKHVWNSKMNVDAIDLKILKYLQDNARLSNQGLDPSQNNGQYFPLKIT